MDISLVILTQSNAYADLQAMRDMIVAQEHQPTEVWVVAKDESVPPVIAGANYLIVGTDNVAAMKFQALNHASFKVIFWQTNRKYRGDHLSSFVKFRQGRKEAPESEARVKKKNLLKKMASFVSAVTGPKASDETFERRLAMCQVCPQVKRKDDKLFCGACGCGKWRLAELHTKLKFADLECPLDPPKWVQESQIAG